MYPGDPKRFHGINERISVKNWEQAVNFFYHMIKNADLAELEPLHHHGEEL
jgi:carboxypeptidase PM20D1